MRLWFKNKNNLQDLKQIEPDFMEILEFSKNVY